MSGLLRKISSLGKNKKQAESPSSSSSAPTATSSSTPATTATTKAPVTTPAATSAPAPVAKEEPTKPAETTVEKPAATTSTAAAPTTATSTKMPAAKIAVIYHSFYGHIAQLAEQAAAGVKESGAEVEILTIPETLSAEVLGKMHANAELGKKYPNVTPDKLKEFDGFVFAFGTRYGRAPAQVSAFFDQTGGLWASGALVGKFASVITSTGGQHGGQETTALTTLPFLAHHGLIYIPIGYQFPEITDMSKIVGGSPWGAGTIAGSDGSRQPIPEELKVAKSHGSYFGNVVGTYVKGKNAA